MKEISIIVDFSWIVCIRSRSDGSGTGLLRTLTGWASYEIFRISSAHTCALKTITFCDNRPLFLLGCYTKPLLDAPLFLAALDGYICMHASLCSARLGCDAMQTSLARVVNTMHVIAGLTFQLLKKIGVSSLSPVIWPGWTAGSWHQDCKALRVLSHG